MPALCPGTEQPRGSTPKAGRKAQTQGRAGCFEPTKAGRCCRVGREQHTPRATPKPHPSQGCPAEQSTAMPKGFINKRCWIPQILPQRCWSCPPSQSDGPSSQRSGTDNPDTSSPNPARISGANPHPQPGEKQQDPRLELGKPPPWHSILLHKTTSPRAEAPNQHMAFAEGRERALKGLCWKNLLLKKC